MFFDKYIYKKLEHETRDNKRLYLSIKLPSLELVRSVQIVRLMVRFTTKKLFFLRGIMKLKFNIIIYLIFLLFFHQPTQADQTKPNLIFSGNFKELTQGDPTETQPLTNDSLITMNLKYNNREIIVSGRYSGEENTLISNTVVYNYQTSRYGFSGELGKNQNGEFMSANFDIKQTKKLTFSGNVFNDFNNNKKLRIGFGFRYTF